MNYGINYDQGFVFIAVIVGLLVLEWPISFAETFTEGACVSPDTVTLKPGEYVWEPERASVGPLLIVASITEQVAYVYRNGIRIARSSCSTGRPGHRTPSGVFTILEKEVHHTSTIFTDKQVDPTTQSPSGFQIIVAQKDKAPPRLNDTWFSETIDR